MIITFGNAEIHLCCGTPDLPWTSVPFYLVKVCEGVDGHEATVDAAWPWFSTVSG
jgi:hypothetical protein